MIKFFWTAIFITISAFIFHAGFILNIQADDNSNHISVDTPNTTIHMNSVADNSADRRVDKLVSVDETSGGSKKPIHGPEQKVSVSEIRTRPVEVKSTEPEVNIKQTEAEHIKQGNGSMYAIDLTTSTGDVYFPKGHSEYVIYFIGEDARLGNYVIIRHGTSRWLFGHTVTSRAAGSYVKTTASDNVLGQYNRSGISTGPHVHIERWDCPEKDSRMRECTNVSSTGEKAIKNAELINQRGWSAPTTSTSVVITDKKIVIACLNENNFTIHKSRNSGLTGCFLGKGGKWKNIMLPSKKDLEIFKKTFGDDYKYRLAIANFEGGFDENAENDFAKGYLQTLKKWKIAPDIQSQLNWLKTREIGTTGRICDLNGWNKTTIERYTCMAGGHLGFFKPGDKHYAHSVVYKKRYKVVTEYYLSLNF